MKILITGANGQLGWELQQVLTNFELILTDIIDNSKIKSQKSKIQIKNPKFIALNITNANKVLEVLEQEKPDWVVHTAAYTNVDGAQDDSETAFAVNRDGSRNVAEASSEIGARLIALSTDYVFDGEDSPVGGYSENDSPNPQSIYGESKLAGEIAILAVCPSAIILRTAWLYGGRPVTNSKLQLKIQKYPDLENHIYKNFPNTILDKLLTNPPAGGLKIVDDQFGCPTYAQDLAQVIKQIIEKPIPVGIYNAVNQGKTSWFEFANEVIEKSKIINRKTNMQIKNNKIITACKTIDFPIKAKRPKDSALSNEKLKKFGIELPGWRAGLKRFFDDVPMFR